MFAFINFDDDFNLPQHPLTSFADRRAEGSDGIRCVEIKDAQKILMLKVFVGFQTAAGHEGVGHADRGGISELCSDVEFIIFLQKAAVNDVEDVVLMILPILLCHLSGDLLQLVGKALFAGDFILLFQRCRNRVLMLRMVLPSERAARILPAARVGNIKDVPNPRLISGIVDEGDPFSATPDIPAHFIVPDLISGAGCRVRALGENHELFVIRIFVKPRGGFEKIRPAFVAGGDLRRRMVGHLRQSLHITRHIENPPFSLLGKKEQPEGCSQCMKTVIYNL